MRKDVHKTAMQGTNNRAREQRTTKRVTMSRPVEGEKEWEIRENKKHTDEIGCRRDSINRNQNLETLESNAYRRTRNEHDARRAQGNEQDE